MKREKIEKYIAMQPEYPQPNNKKSQFSQNSHSCDQFLQKIKLKYEYAKSTTKFYVIQ